VCLCAICVVLVRKTTCNKGGENRRRVDKTAMRSFTVFILHHGLRLSNGTRVAGHNRYRSELTNINNII
jgi:hypothetical protein